MPAMLERLAVLLDRRVRVRGAGRVVQWLYPCRADAPRHVVGVRTRGDGLRMEVDSRQWVDWSLLFRGSFEPQVGALFERLLEPGAVAIDVGANVGAHTLSLAVLAGPAGRVLAFEPNPAIRQRLEVNVALNGFRQVEVYACALGDSEARMPLRVPAKGSAEAANPGMASLVALDTPHDLVDVGVHTLDAVVSSSGVERIDLVKIDVQGYELPVLRGMAAVLRRFRPAVVFEYEQWAWERAGEKLADVFDLFDPRRYALWQVGWRRCLELSPLERGRYPGDHAEILAMARDDNRIASLARAIKGSRND